MIKKLEVDNKKDYLHITDSRELDSSNLEKLLNDILTHGKESNHSKILVDLSSAAIKLDFMDYHMGGVEFAKLFYGFKVAFVFGEIKKDYSYGETVAKNRGADICLFTSIEEAREWLASE
jgi:hypothetical protein